MDVNSGFVRMAGGDVKNIYVPAADVAPGDEPAPWQSDDEYQEPAPLYSADEYQ